MRAGTQKYRVSSVFFTPLNFAEFLGLGMAVVIHLLVEARKWVTKASLALFIPVVLTLIIWTDARLGMVSFFGAFIAYFFIYACRRWYQRRGDIIGPALVLSYPAMVGAFLALSVFWYRLQVMMWGGGQQQASTDARKEQWAMLWPKLADWPFGHGAGNAAGVLGWTNLDGDLSIDSYFISMFLDYGVLGFIAFYGMLLIAMTLAFRLAVTWRSEKGKLAIPVAVMLALFLIIKMVLSQENEHALYFMLLGMVVALVHLEKRERVARGEIMPSRRT